MDDVIITALQGSASAGVAGATSVALPSGSKFATSNQSDGLTIAKLIAAKKFFDLNDVDPSIPKYIVAGATQMSDLLGTTQVTSSDFNTVKALVSGDVDTFMGFRFIMSNRLAVSATDVRTCFVWAEDGLTLGMGKDISARIDERADKGYATQVYYCMSIGAVRMEENKVCQIFCDETPD